MNLYRGRGGTPVWKVASLNCQPVWRLGVLFLERDRARSISIRLFGDCRTGWVYALTIARVQNREKRKILHAIPSQSMTSSMMDIFVNSTPANFHHDTSSRRTSRTSSVEVQQEAAEGDDRSSDQQGNRFPGFRHNIGDGAYNAPMNTCFCVCWGSQCFRQGCDWTGSSRWL